MKTKKHFSFSGGRTIWRVILNNTTLLLVEERDTIKQEVFFHCIDIESGKSIFKDLSFDEKFWIGIEAFEGDMVYFHRYVKPDMPWHKGVIAYSISAKKILWENPDSNYSFFLNGKIYASRQLFESASYSAIDPETGEVLEDLGSDPLRFHALKEEFQHSKNYDEYKFPLFYSQETHEMIFKNAGVVFSNSLGEVEFIEFEDSLIYSTHEKTKTGTLDQKLNIIDIRSKKIIFSEIINKNEKSRMFDSFFTYRRYLIAIKNKIELMVFRLI
jgi:hypothetical protein